METDPDPRSSLRGRTIVLTRAASDNDAWRETLASLGARVIEVPSIRFVPVEDAEKWSEVLHRRREITHLVVTSRHAADFFAERIRAAGLHPSGDWSHVRIAVVGTSTARALEELGFPVHLVSPGRNAIDLATWLVSEEPIGPGSVILFPRSTSGRTELIEHLEASGAVVLAVDIYDTQPEDPARAQSLFTALDRGATIDWIVFASPSAVHGFLAITGERGRMLLDKAPPRAIALGPTTRAMLERARIPVAAAASRPELDSLRAAIETLATESGA